MSLGAQNQDITNLTEAFTQGINRAVEERCRQWIEAAQGIDWTAKFEEILKDNIQKTARIKKLEDLEMTVTRELGAFSGSDLHRDLAKDYFSDTMDLIWGKPSK